MDTDGQLEKLSIKNTHSKFYNCFFFGAFSSPQKENLNTYSITSCYFALRISIYQRLGGCYEMMMAFLFLLPFEISSLFILRSASLATGGKFWSDDLRACVRVCMRRVNAIMYLRYSVL